MSNSLEIKTKLLEQCNVFCQAKLKTIQFQIEEINKALTNETKSSAGDKHETGRAMLQLEREKLGTQLAEQQKLQKVLSRIQINKTSQVIGLGSVVYTTQANYFLAISAGELQVKGTVYYGISIQTPIGKLLLGKTTGCEVEFREEIFTIEKVT
ncbi:GreA/GreB family elongation factor [Hanstruepera marina]|uniref:GreA/GreB family elongation factor n=1 Tax=Hanstruepera marina TaxID=2873265 RepID=UPI001CA72BDB|nr:GreA/GreB family elongation factor [Hanstruepera marina]